ncbi:MAG: DUF937 domain-containing protein [bacterium]
MASLVESLMQQLESRGTVDQIAGRLGVPSGAANSAVSAALPAILAGLAKNTQHPDGAAALATALDKDHDGSALAGDEYLEPDSAQQGEKILGHVFGNQSSAVASQVSALGGLSGGQGADVLKMLAPLVMGYLGKEKSAGGLDASALAKLLAGGTGGMNLPGGLGDLLAGLGGASSSSASGTQSKSPGLGGILGKLFKKK